MVYGSIKRVVARPRWWSYLMLVPLIYGFTQMRKYKIHSLNSVAN
jgi:hypothetical protein